VSQRERLAGTETVRHRTAIAVRIGRRSAQGRIAMPVTGTLPSAIRIAKDDVDAFNAVVVAVATSSVTA